MSGPEFFVMWYLIRGGLAVGLWLFFVGDRS